MGFPEMRPYPTSPSLLTARCSRSVTVTVLRLDDDRFVSDDGPMLRQMADGGLLLLMGGADLADQLSEGEVASIRDLHAVWEPPSGGGGWTMLGDHGRWRVGDHRCWLFDEDEGLTCGGDGARGPHISQAPPSTGSQQRRTVRCGPWVTTTTAPVACTASHCHPPSSNPIAPPRLPAPWRRRPDVVRLASRPRGTRVRRSSARPRWRAKSRAAARAGARSAQTALPPRSARARRGASASCVSRRKPMRKS